MSGSVCTSDGAVDIGHGVTVEVRRIDGEFAGLEYAHPCPQGLRLGWIPVGPPGGWTLESEAPLTLSPSLLCPKCGHHGFIRNGAWVPA